LEPLVGSGSTGSTLSLAQEASRLIVLLFSNYFHLDFTKHIFSVTLVEDTIAKHYVAFLA